MAQNACPDPLAPRLEPESELLLWGFAAPGRSPDRYRQFRTSDFRLIASRL